ncbi:hypothetical protein ACFFRR_009158 [Megaselia abdita]
MEAMQKEEINIRILDLVIEILGNRKLEKAEPSLTTACKLFQVLDYLKLDDSFLLDITNHKDISIFYNERKSILEFLRKEIQIKYTELNPVLEKINQEVEAEKEYQEQIKELENRRLLLKIKLAETKNKKLELLKRCADIKFGPFLANKMEILLDEFMYNQSKFERLKAHILNLYLTSTGNVMKAIEQVSKYLDEITNKS